MCVDEKCVDVDVACLYACDRCVYDVSVFLCVGNLCSYYVHALCFKLHTHSCDLHEIDTGTGAEVFGNCNAPRAVTYSAVIYCLRAMVDLDIPLNQGCLRPVTIAVLHATSYICNCES